MDPTHGASSITQRSNAIVIDFDHLVFFFYFFPAR